MWQYAFLLHLMRVGHVAHFRNALPALRAIWQMHDWKTRALPLTVATLSSVLRFLTNADLGTEAWLHASSANILICSFASSRKRS